MVTVNNNEDDISYTLESYLHLVSHDLSHNKKDLLGFIERNPPLIHTLLPAAGRRHLPYKVLLTYLALTL